MASMVWTPATRARSSISARSESKSSDSRCACESMISNFCAAPLLVLILIGSVEIFSQRCVAPTALRTLFALFPSPSESVSRLECWNGFWQRGAFPLAFQRWFFVADICVASLGPLPEAAQVAIAGQVVGHRGQRPFDGGGRLPATLKLPHAALFLQSPEHRLDHPFAFLVPGAAARATQPLA